MSAWQKKAARLAKLFTRRCGLGLKESLWTDAAIKEFLKPPKDAGPIKARLRKDVEKAEKSLGFISWLELRKAKLVAKGKLNPYPETDAKSRTPSKPRKPRAAKPLPDNVIKFFKARKERGR